MLLSGLIELSWIAGVKADTVTWNSLLSAFGSRDMDGAYQVWLQMQRSGAVPDHYTLKALATAFQGNATLANELVQEAADARASLLAEQDAQQVQLPPGIAYGCSRRTKALQHICCNWSASVALCFTRVCCW